MNKITYIKHLQAEANRKIWNALIEKYKSIRQRNRLFGFLYLIVSCGIVGIVAVFSWLSMFNMLFRDTRFTFHYMQTIITVGNMNDSQAIDYLNTKELEYKKRLSYGNVSMKEKNRIETTFELLYRKYKHPESNNGESITPVWQSINQHTQTVSEYTVWKHSEELKEIERKQQMQDEQAKRKISAHNRAKGRMLDSFESALTEEQLDALVNCCNDIQIFTRDIEAYEIENILSCSHNEPLQVTVNKHLALLFNKLHEHKLICKTWMSVSERHNCFVSKQGKPITSKDLSSALSTASLVKWDIESRIRSCVDTILELD